MIMHGFRVWRAVAVLAAFAFGPAGVAGAAQAAATPVACASLARQDLGAAVAAPTHITRAEEATPEGGGRYCVVTGTIDPEIRFEVRLPLEGWSGRFVQTGCGGLCGNLRINVEHAQSCQPVRDHQVVLSSTDMGHSGMGGEWAARRPAARADFAYRGVHLTTLASKALIRAYYGRPARYAYFSGCSDGGREALIEAQRFPDDFDGIAAGAPALNFTVQNSFYHAWNAVSNTDASGKPIITGAQLPLIHAAVLAACDALDGTRDGIIEDPRRCQFDPAVLACRAGQDPGQCLTAAQVQAVRRIYRGAEDAQGRRLVMGGPMPGSELAWQGVYVPRDASAPNMSRRMADDSVRNLYFDEPLPPSWSVQDLKYDEATLRSFKLRGLYDATDPDLSAFERHGAKLLMWHGWSDPHISPANSIGYYNAVSRLMGAQRTERFARLFLVPGLYHCGGGEGQTEFDVLGALMDWVEQGRAPESLEASGGGLRRPVYAYPDRAQLAAGGAWQRVKGELEPKAEEWLGADFFRPGYELK